MRKESPIPKYISVVAVARGCADAVRGFWHTFLLSSAASKIAQLYRSTSVERARHEHQL